MGASYVPPRYDSDNSDAYNPYLGIRARKTAATLPAGTTQNIFVVTGDVAITLLRGNVTTTIQAQACNLKISSVPTVGTAVDIAANVDINADEVGTHYIAELDGTALVANNAGAGPNSGQFFAIIPAGTIRIQTSATNTGATEWELWYFPLDDGATVASA